MLAGSSDLPMQQLARRFLFNGALWPNECCEGDVRRLVQRSYVPFGHQWRIARAVLAQDYFLLFGSDGSQVELCICVLSITDVAVDAEPTESAEIPLHRGNSWPGPTPRCVSCIGDTPRIKNPAKSLPPRRLRIVFLTGNREKELVLQSDECQCWASALDEARAQLRANGFRFRQFIPMQRLRSWLEDALSDVGVSAEARTSGGGPSRLERLAAGLGALAAFMRSAHGADLQRALSLLRCMTVLARKQKDVAARLGLHATRLAAQAALTEAFTCWRDAGGLSQRCVCNTGCTRSFQPSCAEALAQALEEEWRPVWALRAAVLEQALGHVIRQALATSLHRFRDAALVVPAIARGSGIAASGLDVLASQAMASAAPDVAASCRCLVITLRQCVRSRTGSAWRMLVCATSRHRVSETLNALESRLEEKSEELVTACESSARHHGLRRLCSAVRRVVDWQLRISLLELASSMPAHAARGHGHWRGRTMARTADEPVAGIAHDTQARESRANCGPWLTQMESRAWQSPMLP